MARQRRTLDEQIAELVTRGRSSRTEVQSTPGMTSITGDIIEFDSIGFEHLDEQISQDLTDMSDSLGKAKNDLTDLNLSLNEARRDLTEIDGKLDDAAFDLVNGLNRIDNEILPAINDAAASPITDARLSAGSLSIWPFASKTIPQGALVAGAVGANEIADFSMVAKKFKDDRHRLY